MTATADPSSAEGEPAAPVSGSPSGAGRIRAAAGAAGAAILGAAPHVLHHAGPLAGAAVLAGATGTLLFGAAGFLLTIPMLRRIRRRTGSWRVPGALLALMAGVFALSSLVIGPAIAGDGEESDEPARPLIAPERRPGHDEHH